MGPPHGGLLLIDKRTREARRGTDASPTDRQAGRRQGFLLLIRGRERQDRGQTRPHGQTGRPQAGFFIINKRTGEARQGTDASPHTQEGRSQVGSFFNNKRTRGARQGTDASPGTDDGRPPSKAGHLAGGDKRRSAVGGGLEADG